MKVSKDLDLAARALIYLAGKPQDAGAVVDEFSKALGEAPDVLEGLMELLRKGKVVKTRRNVGQDEYLLRLPASKIRIGMIVDALQPREAWELSFGHEGGTGREYVGEYEGRPAWNELEKVILRGLKEYTLDHLAWDTAFRLDP